MVVRMGFDGVIGHYLSVVVKEHNQQNHHLFHLSTFFGQLSCPHYFKCKVSGYLVPK